MPRLRQQMIQQGHRCFKLAGSLLNNMNHPTEHSSSRDTGTILLQNIDFQAKPGQVCLLMGGSGSGKTTLLNVIAGRVNKQRMAVSGDVLFNGEDARVYNRRRRQQDQKSGQVVGYLTQEDHLLPFITVRETLQFGIEMRLSALSREEREALIKSISSELGLQNCLDTRVGDGYGASAGQNSTGGISGGERRRLSAALQLLTRPEVLICDEVTSGLDAFTALELIKTLSSYAVTSKSTVLISIHQPRSEICHLLSDLGGQLVLLSQGQVVYSGPLRRLLTWFPTVGLKPCPTHMNPLDYALDMCSTVLSNHTSNADNNALRRSNQGAPALECHVEEGLVGSDGDSAYLGLTSEKQQDLRMISQHQLDNSGGNAGLWRQVGALCRRNWLNTQRNALLFWGSLMVHILLSLSVSVVFWRVGKDVDDGGSISPLGLRARASVSYLLCTFQPFLSMTLMIYKGVQEMEVFDRERREQLYGPAAFVISHSICNIPGIIISTSVGLRTDSIDYLRWYLLVNILLQLTTFALAMLCTSVERNFDRSTLLGSAFFLPFAMTAGFIVSSSQIPYFLRWIKFISPHRLAYQILISLEFSTQQYGCAMVKQTYSGDGVSSMVSTVPSSTVKVQNAGLCTSTIGWDGDTILQSMLLEGTARYFPGPIGLLAIHYGVFTLAAWFVLRIRSVDQARDGPESTYRSPIEYALSFVICLFRNKGHAKNNGISRSGEGNGGRAGEAQIKVMHGVRSTRLMGVAIRVENLSLSLPMGSRCLSSLRVPWRVQETVAEKWLLQNLNFEIPSGQLTAILGGSGSGKTTILNALSHRIPSNLQFSGNILFNGVENPPLRYISRICGYVRQDDGFLMSHLTVRETLRYAAELGLDASITQDEKWQRVEETMELMGLHESLSVIQVLKRVAASGQTVVCAVHQPRVDIWNEFDNVLLLMSGGRLAYSGKAKEAIGYFAQAGYALPKHTNPSDYMIDILSSSTKSPELQEASKSRMEALAQRYQLYCGNIATELVAISPQNPPSLNTLRIETLWCANFFSASKILTRRSFTNAVRQRGSYINRIAQPVVIVLLTVLFFWRLDPKTSVGLMNRLGLFHQLMGATLAGMMVHTEVFPKERDIAFREISDGRYCASSFLVSYMVNELPLSLISASISAAVIFLVTGLQTTAISVASMVLVILAYVTAGESIGIMYSSCLLKNGGLGVAFMNSVVLWMSFMAGFLVPRLPWILEYMNYASIFRYAARIVSLNEFQELGPVGNGAGGSVDGEGWSTISTSFQSGEAVLHFLGFEDGSLSRSVGMLVGLMVVYRMAAWGVVVAKARYGLQR
ncbi:ATP-binding cassette sub- G member 5 [Mortierella claussenii]|nr:ATP-binding cassette sub- G member 5 [Mortierella claussenii]